MAEQHRPGQVCVRCSGAVRYIAALARYDRDTLTGQANREQLRDLAKVLRVRSTGRKADVAGRIIDRAGLLVRMRRLGEDPRELARVFRRSSLATWVAELGGFTGLNKHGLAVTIINLTADTYYSLALRLTKDKAAQAPDQEAGNLDV